MNYKQVGWLVFTIVVETTIIIALIGAVVEKTILNTKYETIIDAACSTTMSPSQCRDGVTVLKEMDASTIKKMGK